MLSSRSSSMRGRHRRGTSGPSSASRGVDVDHPFTVGDALPGGIQAFQTARMSEVVYWLPRQSAVVVGDVLLGAGAKPHATDDPLRLCPERWLDGATHDALRES